MEMGKEIRRLRNERGLTQEALAAALNVTAQTVSKWECSVSVPDVQLLPEIAVFFGVSIDTLFAMSPEQQLDRIENHIYSRGLFTEAEQRQLERQLASIAEDEALSGKAELMLARLYSNQSEQFRLMAIERAKTAAEKTGGDAQAISELANAWNSYIPDWNARNHHELIEWFKDFSCRHPDNRPSLMWLLDNLIDDRRLTEARIWLKKLEKIDSTYRAPMYRYLIAQAAGELREAEEELKTLESMEGQDWAHALTLGDIYTQRQEYEKAVTWYRRAQETQPSPKFIDSAVSIAHIREIQGNKEGAAASYKEALSLLKEDWGLVRGPEVTSVERAVQKLK